MKKKFSFLLIASLLVALSLASCGINIDSSLAEENYYLGVFKYEFEDVHTNEKGGSCHVTVRPDKANPKMGTIQFSLTNAKDESNMVYSGYWELGKTRTKDNHVVKMTNTFEDKNNFSFKFECQDTANKEKPRHFNFSLEVSNKGRTFVEALFNFEKTEVDYNDKYKVMKAEYQLEGFNTVGTVGGLDGFYGISAFTTNYMKCPAAM